MTWMLSIFLSLSLSHITYRTYLSINQAFMTLFWPHSTPLKGLNRFPQQHCHPQTITIKRYPRKKHQWKRKKKKEQLAQHQTQHIPTPHIKHYPYVAKITILLIIITCSLSIPNIQNPPLLTHHDTIHKFSIISSYYIHPHPYHSNIPPLPYIQRGPTMLPLINFSHYRGTFYYITQTIF